MLDGGQQAMENGSNYFFPCSWDGEDRSGAVCRVQPAGKVALGAEGLQDQPWICSVVETGEVWVGVCVQV